MFYLLLLHAFFLINISLLQKFVFTSNNISSSNSCVRELSLWKPAFPPQMAFLLFRLIPTTTTNAPVHFQVSEVFTTDLILTKTILHAFPPSDWCCSIEWIVFAEASPPPLLLKWGTLSAVPLRLHNLTLRLTWSTVDNLPACLVNFRSTVNKTLVNS